MSIRDWFKQRILRQEPPPTEEKPKNLTMEDIEDLILAKKLHTHETAIRQARTEVFHIEGKIRKGDFDLITEKELEFINRHETNRRVSLIPGESGMVVYGMAIGVNHYEKIIWTAPMIEELLKEKGYGYVRVIYHEGAKYGAYLFPPQSVMFENVSEFAATSDGGITLNPEYVE